jgi:hypothetical protein
VPDRLDLTEVPQLNGANKKLNPGPSGEDTDNDRPTSRCRISYLARVAPGSADLGAQSHLNFPDNAGLSSSLRTPRIIGDEYGKHIHPFAHGSY